MDTAITGIAGTAIIIVTAAEAVFGPLNGWVKSRAGKMGFANAKPIFV